MLHVCVIDDKEGGCADMSVTFVFLLLIFEAQNIWL